MKINLTIIFIFLMGIFLSSQFAYAADPVNGELYHCEDEFGGYVSSFPCDETPGVVECTYCHYQYPSDEDYCPKTSYCAECGGQHHSDQKCPKESENEEEDDSNGSEAGGGSGGNSGGDTGSGGNNADNNTGNNGGSTPGTLPHVPFRTLIPQALNQLLLVRWDLTKDCFSTAAELLQKLNGDCNIGSPTTAFIIPLIIDGVVVYDMSRSLEAFEIIKNHIDNKRAIMVGLDYKDGSPNSDGITDHFVPVVGYGMDLNGNWYLQFLESGTSDPYNQFSSDNRLYLDSENGSWQKSNDNSDNEMTYKVTQVRPNQ